MRVPVVAALLLLLALARPGAAGDAPGESPEPAAAEDPLSRHLQSFSELLSRGVPQGLRPQELRTHAEQYLERAQQHLQQLEPLAQELRTNVLGLFSSLLQLGKGQGDSA